MGRGLPLIAGTLRFKNRNDMPLILTERQPELIEYMDREDCDPVLLQNTYRQFATINALLSQWKKVYENELKPLMNTDRTYTLLDIGFGGGDVPLKLLHWAKRDKINLKITAIEIDQRAFQYADSLSDTPNLDFRHCSSADLVREGLTFDFVISNHVLHHLKNTEAHKLLHESESLTRKKVVFNDIERSDIGYVLFTSLARLLFRKSYIVADGLTSIKRSYTFNELTEIAPPDWKVKRLFPYRLLLIYEKN